MNKGDLPLHEYFSLHAYLSTLLVSVFIFLPRSTLWFIEEGSQRSSADRPEHPFLTPITSRPLTTMTWDVLGMLVCMVWWGARLSRWSKGTAQTSHLVGEHEVTAREQRTSKMVKTFFEAAASTLAGATVLFVLLCALGAPLDSHYMHTALLALHLSLLIVWPVIQTLGVPSIYDNGLHARYRMTRLFCDFRPETQLERALVYPVIGTLIGATVGVLPIPLDWDRPWQSYPLTISFASILGFVIGGFVSFVQSALAAGLFEETTKPSAPSVKVSSKKKRRS